MERKIGQISSVFKAIHFVSNRLGDRNNLNERRSFLDFIANNPGYTSIPLKRIVGLTGSLSFKIRILLPVSFLTLILGTRFIEITKNGAMLYLFRNAITEFFTQSPVVSVQAAREFSALRNSVYFDHLREDLFAIVLVTVAIVEPLMRASLVLETNILRYKMVLMSAIELANDCDFDRKFENLLSTETSAPSLHFYVKADDHQQRVLDRIDSFSEAQRARVVHIVHESTLILSESLESCNAALMTTEFTDITSRAIHNNNYCERTFSVMDFLGRTRQNLSFCNRESITLAKTNRFFDWFDQLTLADQFQMLNRGCQLTSSAHEFLERNAAQETTIRRELEEQDRLNDAARREKRDSDQATLLTELKNCVPYRKEDYEACLALFKRSNPSSSELSFLKKQLKLRKIQSNGALPNQSFTVSNQGRPLSLSAIRDKFFALLNEE